MVGGAAGISAVFGRRGAWTVVGEVAEGEAVDEAERSGYLWLVEVREVALSGDGGVDVV